MSFRNEDFQLAHRLHGDEEPCATELQGNVLVVDDCPQGRELVSRVLRSVGLIVQTAENGLEACHQAVAALREDRPFDLILMDMDMPVMNGHSAAAYLRELGYTGRIAALTATSHERSREDCLDAGCDDFATKPITFDMLVNLAKRNLQVDSLPMHFKTARQAVSASRLPPSPEPLCA